MWISSVVLENGCAEQWQETLIACAVFWFCLCIDTLNEDVQTHIAGELSAEMTDILPQ